MLDIKFIRDNPEVVRRAAAKKRIPFDVDQLLAVDAKRRGLLATVEELRAEKNRASQRIPALKGEEKQAAIRSMREVDTRLKQLGPELAEAEKDFAALMLLVPNIPADDVPDGESEDDNVEVRRWGTPRSLDFEPLDHVELGEKLDIIDIPRGVKLAGSRSYFLKNEGALLEIAVLRFALDLVVAKGFVPMVVPVMVKDEAMVGTGYFPGGEEQAYRMERDQLNLVGTAEVSLTAYHMDEVLAEEELPKHFAGISPCFRREAGAAGKDTRGLYRLHQFQKVEQVVVCAADPEVSRREHEFILGNAEELVRELGLPYRVVAVCGGDLGRPQVRKNDIECWMPSRGKYGETHSCSTMHEFQARRLNMRYRTADGKLKFCHTLNNTLLASPRILIPILENYQRADGSVVIPEVLRPYMGGQEKIEPKKRDAPASTS